VEHTTTASTRFQLLSDGSGLTTTSQTFEKSNTNVLPSVHLTYEVNENLQFRGAWTNTIGRPDYEELASFSEVDVEGNEASVTKGNPNLDPYRAMNFDLSGEYYFENGGLASVAGFYKRIDNAIYQFTDTETNVTNPFGNGETFSEVETTQQRNADLGTVLGLEATYQQPFTFLPAPLDGLGLNSNVTVTDSEVDVPNRGELPFFQQADLVYNVVPYFQKAGFEARVAVNYRGDYLLSLDDAAVNDTWVDDRTTVDVNASYQFEGLLAQPTLMVQVENVTNAPEIEYAGGDEDRLSFHYLSGRTVSLGLSAEF
jgi:TonB-dependent receptor